MFKKRQAHVEGMVVGSDKSKRRFQWPKSRKQLAEAPSRSAPDTAPELVSATDMQARAMKKRRRTMMFGVLLAAALIVSVGVGYWWTNRFEEAKKTQEFAARDTSDPVKEVAFFEKKVADYPKDNLSQKQKRELADLYNGLGAAYTNNGQEINGIKAYQAAADLAGSDAERRSALTGLALSYTEAGETEKAIQAYEALIELEAEINDRSSNMNASNYRKEIERLRNGQ